MKKNWANGIKTVIIIATSCLLLGIIKVHASEVIFDADAVREKTASKSSLLDVNGIFVFRDAFIEREKIVKQEQKETMEKMETLVLLSPQQDFDYETWVNLVLTADTGKYIKDVYNEKEESNLRWWVYCGTVSICVLCIAVWIEDTRKKKKEETKGEVAEDERYGDI